jgi:hypothetical protein
VLGVVRTLTSATRLLDVMALLRPEDGVDVSYTVNPGSAFSDGLERYLTSIDTQLISWSEARGRARRGEFDLAVACTVHPSMRDLRIPLLVMPHGAGYNRLVPEATGDTVSPAGLSRRELMHRGRVVPTTIGLSHESQLDRLVRTCPEAAPRARVIGDWCYDRIHASLSHRDRYRQNLGVTHGQQLVVVNSTWSEHSLLGRHPDLPLRLVTALPADEYAVAVVIHPNVWARHSMHGVLQRLEPAMHAGLRVIRPEEGWRAAIIASDLVIGDHGSTSYYSAAIDRVMLLAATGLDELDPESGTAAFVRSLPQLDPKGDLYAQLRDAAGAHVPGQYATVTAQNLGAQGESGRIVTDVLYQPLAHRGVHPSVHNPNPLPVPDPEPERRPGPTTYDVDGARERDRTVVLRRWPKLPHDPTPVRGFLVVDESESHEIWKTGAEVMVRTVSDAQLAPQDWLRMRMARHIGLHVAVATLAADRCLVRLGDGRLLEAHAPQQWGTPHTSLDPVLLGAAVYVWLTAPDAPPLEPSLTYRAGRRTATVVFREK